MLVNQSMAELRFLLESNGIEGVYDLESLQDAKLAWDYLSSTMVMSEEIIREAHKLLMSNHSGFREIGSYRKEDSTVGGTRRVIASGIEKSMAGFVKEINTPCESQQAFKDLHVKFEKIHPFADGNGRLGRMLYNWQRLKNGYSIQVFYEKDKYVYFGWFKQV